VDNTTLPVPVEVVTPVPPLATGSAVPEYETAKVPLVVIGEPDIDRKEGTDIATDETVALDAAFDANSLTVPALFLKYSFSSKVLRASSPATKLAANGAVDAVVL
jgi:hypothetical protein